MKTVLIVDDEPEICDALCRLFDRLGFLAMTAEEGSTGLSMFKAINPDLVLTDMIMPQKDGLELIREIRNYDSEVKIIAISGGGNTGPLAYKPDAIKTSAFLQAAEDAGADCTLTKPFTRAEISSAVASLGLLNTG